MRSFSENLHPSYPYETTSLVAFHVTEDVKIVYFNENYAQAIYCKIYWIYTIFRTKRMHKDVVYQSVDSFIDPLLAHADTLAIGM